MYYVRRLTSNSNVSKIKNATDIGAIDADILKQEFGTTGNTLSFWKCEELGNIKDTIKAILLSGTHIKAARFFILNDDLIQKYGLTMDNAEPGKTGYAGFGCLHVNMTSLTYGKIGDMLRMLNELFQDEAVTPKLGKPEVKQYIREVKEAGLLDEENMDEDMKTAISKYC